MMVYEKCEVKKESTSDGWFEDIWFFLWLNSKNAKGVQVKIKRVRSGVLKQLIVSNDCPTNTTYSEKYLPRGVPSPHQWGWEGSCWGILLPWVVEHFLTECKVCRRHSRSFADPSEGSGLGKLHDRQSRSSRNWSFRARNKSQLLGIVQIAPVFHCTCTWTQNCLAKRNIRAVTKRYLNLPPSPPPFWSTIQR